MKKISIIILIGITLAARRFPGTARAGTLDYNYIRSLDKVSKIFSLIKEHYVDPGIENSQLTEGAIAGMIAALNDPYTRYMNAEVYQEMKQEAVGQFGGLGIVITIKNKHLTIISPIEDTPAYRAGIQPGDIIVRANGEEVGELSLYDAVKLLRGPKGTKLNITVKREGQDKLLNFDIVRDIIKIQSVKLRNIEDNTYYIRLTQFIETTARDLENILRDITPKNPKGIILDLRNNPGGLLEAAVQVCRLLIPKGPIVSIKGRGGRSVDYSVFDERFTTSPLIVLINNGSASAAEIVAGAIQDTHRGLLVGTPTFGKGSVQTVLDLEDGSALALTTAWYYTPSGRCIHKKGITPDIEVKLPELTEEQLQEQQNERERYLNDPKYKDQLIVSKFDTQLQRAIDIIKSYDVFRKLQQ